MTSPQAQRIIDGLASRPTSRQAVAELTGSDTPVLLEIVSAALASDPPRAGWYLGGISDRLPFTALEDLAAQALEHRVRGPNRAADDVIADIALQDPEALTAHLPVLWELAPNRATYYAQWPWRAAGDAEIARLQDIMHGDGADAGRARACLLQTRLPDILDWLEARDYELLAAGYRRERSGTLTALYSEPAWHLAFPAGILNHWTARSAWRGGHPTWPAAGGTGPDAITSGFLDATCPRCGYRLHRLLALTACPPGMLVSAQHGIEFAWCAACSPFAHVTYVHHDVSGSPAGITLDMVIMPDLPSRTELESWFIPQTRVQLVPLGPRWQRQDWAQSNDRQNLHRAGGEPTWIQDPAYPACPGCATVMNSAGQIAVEDLWNGEGICYLRWCGACTTSAVVYQQT